MRIPQGAPSTHDPLARRSQSSGAAGWFGGGAREVSAPDLAVARTRLAHTGLDDAGRTHPRRVYVGGAVTLLLLSAMSTFIELMPQVNLNRIEETFQSQQVYWVITAVPLAGALFIIPLAKLGDVYGKKLVLLVEVVAVLAGSLMCATTHNFSLFLLGRALQGISAGVIVQCYGLIRDLVPRQRIPAAIGLTAAGFAVSVPVSELMSGVLLNQHTYQALFWWMAGEAGLSLVMTLLFIPASPLRTPETPDWVGIGFASTASFAVIYGLNEASVPARGWTSAWTIGFLTLAVVLWVGFFVYERVPDIDRPDSGLLQSSAVVWTLVVGLFAGGLLILANAMTSSIAATPSHLGPLTLGYGLGLSAHQTGIDQLPGAVVGFGCALGAGWYIRRRGARAPMILGVALLTVSVAAGLLIGDHVAVYVAVQIVASAAIYLILTAGPLLVMEAVHAHYQGWASGFFSVSLNVGNAISTQLVALAFAHDVIYTDPASSASVSGVGSLHIITIVAAGFGLLALVAAMLLPHGRGPNIGGALADALGRTPHVAPSPVAETAYVTAGARTRRSGRFSAAARRTAARQPVRRQRGGLGTATEE